MDSGIGVLLSDEELNEGVEVKRDTSAPVLYTPIFKKLCPKYLAMGMTPDEYWNGEPELAKYYREAHTIRRDERNQELWLQGYYIYQALGAVAPIFNANSKKGTKASPYMESPIPLSNQAKEVDAEVKEKKQYELNKARFMGIITGVNERFKADGKD